MEKQFKASAIGSNADIQAGVDISKVVGGYFENPENTKGFCEVGIKPLEGQLPHEVRFVDFGGGDGFLASQVEMYLKNDGFVVDALVMDGNESYVEKAKQRGLATTICNLEECNIDGVNLATVRAVLHYNPPEKQLAIINNICRSLNEGGYFVHQVSSGSDANCKLRSAIVNIPELGRAGSGQYHWTSIDETLKIHNESGFSDTKLAGFAPGASWGPDEQWDRFNAKRSAAAKEAGDVVAVNEIEEVKKKYLEKANILIEDFLEKYGVEETGIEKLADGRYMVNYQYPIIVSKK